jgi:hypothetical protein
VHITQGFPEEVTLKREMKVKQELPRRNGGGRQGRKPFKTEGMAWGQDLR